MKLASTVGLIGARCCSSMFFLSQKIWNMRRPVPYVLLVLVASVLSRTCLILARSVSLRFVGSPLSSSECRAFAGFHNRMRSLAEQCGRRGEGFREGIGDSSLGRDGVSLSRREVLSRASIRRGRLGGLVWLFICCLVRVVSALLFKEGKAWLWFRRKASRRNSFAGLEGGIEVNEEGFDLFREADWGEEEVSWWEGSSRGVICGVFGGVDVSCCEDSVAFFQ